MSSRSMRIDIPARQIGWPSELPLSSSGAYVPVHRRKASMPPTPFSSASTTPFSTPATSAAPSEAGSGRTTPDSAMFDSHGPSPSASGIPIYTRADLLLLAHSPLAKLAPSAKAEMKDLVPCIVLSRRKAESRKWKAKHAHALELGTDPRRPRSGRSSGVSTPYEAQTPYDEISPRW